jgi:tRNA1(Val) A37 N6-methylase TrmN6
LPSPEAAPATTTDLLLGGRVRLTQPAQGYRAAIDPVLLAASVPAAANEAVLEGGLGAGAAALCLLARVPGASVTGVEIDPAMAGLAAANAAANEAALEVVNADLLGFRQGRFAHAMANPPFQEAGSGSASPLTARRRADREAAPGALGAWVAALARRLEARGTLTLVLPAARLSEAAAAMREAGLGAVTLLPLWPRADEPAKRMLLRGVKTARGPDRVLPGLVLHQASGAYTEATLAVLRHGAALDLG